MTGHWSNDLNISNIGIYLLNRALIFPLSIIIFTFLSKNVKNLIAAQKVIPQEIESFLMKMRVAWLSELCTEGHSPPNGHLYDERISY